MSRSFAILQVLLFNKESILKGFGRCRLFSSCSCVLDDRSIPLSLVSVTDVANIELSPKVSDSAPESPTTSMSLSLSIASVPRCARYSRFKATRSTVIPGMMGNCALIEHFFFDRVLVFTFGAQFSCLPFQGFLELFPASRSFSGSKLRRGNRFARAGLGMSVVGRPPWTLFCVLFFPPFGPPILKPHLKSEDQRFVTNHHPSV